MKALSGRVIVAIVLQGASVISAAENSTGVVLDVKWGAIGASPKIVRFFQLLREDPGNISLRARLADEYSTEWPVSAEFMRMTVDYLQGMAKSFDSERLYASFSGARFCRNYAPWEMLSPLDRRDAELLVEELRSIHRDFSEDLSSWREQEQRVLELLNRFGTNCAIYVTLSDIWRFGLPLAGRRFPVAKAEASVRLLLELSAFHRNGQVSRGRADLLAMASDVLSFHGDYVGSYVALCLALDAVKKDPTSSAIETPESFRHRLERGKEKLARRVRRVPRH